MSSCMHCDEKDNATMRGRTPAHGFQRRRKLLLDSLLVKWRRQLLRRNMCGNKSNMLIKRSSSEIDGFLFEALCYHHYSHDKNMRPNTHYKLSPLASNDLFDQISIHDFCHACSFWPEKFKEITEAL